VINFLLKKINKELAWIDDLEKLFLDFSNVDRKKM
jgi:hypothetical protein